MTLIVIPRSQEPFSNRVSRGLLDVSMQVHKCAKTKATVDSPVTAVAGGRWCHLRPWSDAILLHLAFLTPLTLALSFATAASLSREAKAGV